jgi:hypothetical protein
MYLGSSNKKGFTRSFICLESEIGGFRMQLVCHSIVTNSSLQVTVVQEIRGGG